MFVSPKSSGCAPPPRAHRSGGGHPAKVPAPDRRRPVGKGAVPVYNSIPIPYDPIPTTPRPSVRLVGPSRRSGRTLLRGPPGWRSRDEIIRRCASLDMHTQGISISKLSICMLASSRVDMNDVCECVCVCVWMDDVWLTCSNSRICTCAASSSCAQLQSQLQLRRTLPLAHSHSHTAGQVAAQGPRMAREPTRSIRRLGLARARGRGGGVAG